MKRELGKTGIMMALLLMSMALMAYVPTVRASGTIYIRADGSIDPPDAPITTVDNVTYTLIANITSDADGIVVERSNIIIDGAGYTVEGMGTVDSKGIRIQGQTNVTIKNTNIKGFDSGIYLRRSNYNSVSENNITNNWYGIWLDGDSSYNSIFNNTIHACTHSILFWRGCNYNSISGNNIIANSWSGIWLWGCNSNSISGNTIINIAHGIFLYTCSNNNISGNSIIANYKYGIWLDTSSNNNIFGNNITNNYYGIYLDGSSNNKFYHNNFVDNTQQVCFYWASYVNIWDDGYPSGGNYWSDYVGVDEKSGPNQDQPGSDGIGDTPYIIDESNKDRFPLMDPYHPDVAIGNVTPYKNIVGQGYKMKVNVTVANEGYHIETFNITLYANTTAIETREITLMNDTSTTLTFTWNTSGFVKGNYTLWAYADPVPGETDLGDNIFTDGWAFVTIPGDVDASRKVEMIDLWLVQKCYGSKIGDPRYNPNMDIDDNGKIEMIDLWITQKHYGQHW